jgi:hypothetical protein
MYQYPVLFEQATTKNKKRGGGRMFRYSVSLDLMETSVSTTSSRMIIRPDS